MKLTLSLALALLLVLPLAAQLDMPKPNLNPWQGGGTSLLSMDRLSMSHSMGFAAGTSSSGRGFYSSSYTNHLKYQFNPKLDLALDLNFVNFGTAANGFKLNDDNKSRIIPEFKLNYRPSDSFHITVEFNQGNPWQAEPTPWYERW